MNAYIVFYQGRQTKIYASTSHDARMKGVSFFRVPAKKEDLVSAHLVEKEFKGTAESYGVSDV